MGAGRLMSFFFNLPVWIKPHLYSHKKFEELSDNLIEELKNRLARFTTEEPDISVVIPAWNEEDTLFRTLSSLASNQIPNKVEIIVVNNNSTDKTQEILERLGVRNFSESQQGIAFARQLGLTKARGQYHLCADSDTLYPPDWIELMVKPMRKDPNIVGVYGRYSFLPRNTEDLPILFFYEKITGLLIRLRRLKREFVNVLGFNMGFITEIGRNNGGFQVKDIRKFDNAPGSSFVDESEDGTMALNLMKTGKLKLVTDRKARVFTSTRRLDADGGILEAFISRGKLHSTRLREYISGH
ncbi:glycosyltransferase family A protein [Daejeonella sp. JGW-45]|uniref:glycosyltransferase family A protein n=1 Tax=Daejeonella sp. JGW-45 TaxID=3034148 RepID=UPI0023EDD107|nr:glycosyltransferase family A protein [Daejeonella sp. JGW-45]